MRPAILILSAECWLLVKVVAPLALKGYTDNVNLQM